MLAIGAAGTALAQRDEPVITTLADFEDDAVAVTVTDAVNAALSDCRAQYAKIPARGQRCLQLDVGATQPRASAACDLRFRMATPFSNAYRAAVYTWITQGSVALQFRVRDAQNRIFETSALPLKVRNRWVRLSADITADQLKFVGSEAGVDNAVPVLPIEILGLRIHSENIGRQVVFVDDLEVEHRAAGAGVLRGEFQFNEPTRIYSPGSSVRAAIVLENISRKSALPLGVKLDWRHSDGTQIAETSISINLPPSGIDYRSRQPVDFSQEIQEPGLYHLTAEVRGPLWDSPAVFQTTIAVTFPNRGLPRGRSGFFGMQSNLLREPAADQRLEIDIARDLGVQLLALDTPWRLLEPKEGRFDFDALGDLLNRLGRLDMAVMLLIADPPEWVAKDPEKLWQQQTNFCVALAQRLGERLYGIRPAAPTPGVLTESDVRALSAMTQKINSVRRNIRVIAPPILISSKAPETALPPSLPDPCPFELTFETHGSADGARTALAAFAEKNGIRWNANHRWFHYSAGQDGSGGVHDAVAMLHHYVGAAREGVGGVVWCELRDDTNDSRFPERMRGLVQRDFSPKNALIGFANVVGVLNGVIYSGNLPGTPDEFDSALFLGGKRQVAVLCPKPNRVLPAVISPYQIVPGEMIVFDFDRRALPLAESAVPLLVETQTRPFFISFAAQQAQSEPQIGLARPWLDVPRTVYCDEQTVFHIRITAPQALRRSYLSFTLPDGAPIKSSLSSRGLRAESGATLDLEVTITREAELNAPVSCTLRINLEGSVFQVPIEIRPQSEVAKLTDATDLFKERTTIGALADPRLFEQKVGKTQRRNKSISICPLYAGYQDRKLHLAAALPTNAAPEARLYIGLAIENAEGQVEMCIENPSGTPRLRTVNGTAEDQLRNWRCVKVEQGGQTYCHIQVSPRALNRSDFAPNERLLLSVRYEEPAASARARPRILEWGSGLAEERSTTLYRWVALADPSRP